MRFIVTVLMIAVAGGLGQQGAPGRRAPLDKEFAIKFGEEVAVPDAGMRIKFASVVEDSRCPEGVQCIWEGNGKITLRLSKPKGKSTHATLNTGMAPNEAAFRNHKVRLVRLAPTPREGEKIEPSRYEATLVVTRN